MKSVYTILPEKPQAKGILVRSRN